MVAPTISCTTTLPASCVHETASPPTVIAVVNASVRSTASGSLSPDSSSNVAPTRRCIVSPLPRSTLNTAAASVDDTIAPSNNASGQLSPKSHAPSATSAAVAKMPTVAREVAAPQYGRTLLSGVFIPPSNKISTSAMVPARKASP